MRKLHNVMPIRRDNIARLSICIYLGVHNLNYCVIGVHNRDYFADNAHLGAVSGKQKEQVEKWIGNISWIR